MIPCTWDKLPEWMRTEEIRPYWDVLRKKKASLVCKRLFDIVMSFLLLILLSPLFLILSITIKMDSKGPVFYRQERITQYGKVFRIHKFRSMYVGSDQKGQITFHHDKRVTKVGETIRKYKLDEVSQLIDIIEGNMSFVGTRPEVKKYVDTYTNEMKATLLLPAGVTSTASILYRNENVILDGSVNINQAYIQQILPQKMKLNLDDIKEFGFWRDLNICLKTIKSVI